MARIFMDGFESGNLDLWDVKQSFTINSSEAGRQGSYCGRIATSPYAGIYVGSRTEIYVAFKARIDDTNISPAFLNFSQTLDVNSNGARLNINGSAALGAYSGSNAGVTLLGTSASIFREDEWYLIEIYFKLADSGGRFVVKLNGITEIDFTGDTKYSTNTDFSYVWFGGYGSSSVIYIDDFILDDANWIGDTTIQKLSVTGAGNSTQFDPSTGNNWDCVDAIPATDGTWVSTNVSGEIDTYTMANLDGVINSVKAVQVQARCQKGGALGKPNIKLAIRPGSTDRLSANKAATAFTPKSVFNIWQTNPDTSNPWASGEVNASEIGIQAES